MYVLMSIRKKIINIPCIIIFLLISILILGIGCSEFSANDYYNYDAPGSGSGISEIDRGYYRDGYSSGDNYQGGNSNLGNNNYYIYPDDSYDIDYGSYDDYVYPDDSYEIDYGNYDEAKVCEKGLLLEKKQYQICDVPNSEYILNAGGSINNIYRTKIFNLIEEISSRVFHEKLGESSGYPLKDIGRDHLEFFLSIVKATALQESSLRHYNYQAGLDYYFIKIVDFFKSDGSFSLGLMQIHTRWHPLILDLEGQIDYAAHLLYEKYIYALSNICSSGTNYGNSPKTIARRVYAQYNRYKDDMCTNNHKHDNLFIEKLRTVTRL